MADDCPCCPSLSPVQVSGNWTSGQYRTSSLKVSGKEAFILFLFFLLLLYSVVTFLKSWNKNYRDINHLPFYTMCEDKSSIAPGVLNWEDGGSMDLGGMGLSRTDSRMSRVVMDLGRDRVRDLVRTGSLRQQTKSHMERTKSYHSHRHRPTSRLTMHRRSISTSDLFSRPPCLEEPEQSSCLPSSSPHKLDPVLEEEKKGEEEKEEDEEEEEEEEEVKGEKNKGNGWKGKEDEGEIRTFCEITKPGEIEGNAVENAKVEKKNKVNPPESSELQKKSRLCTGAAGAEVEVHR